jgi:lysozyme
MDPVHKAVWQTVCRWAAGMGGGSAGLTGGMEVLAWAPLGIPLPFILGAISSLAGLGLGIWRCSPAAPATAPTIDPPGAHDTQAAGSDIPAAAIDIVAHFEGFRPEAYLCPAGVYTMGYGSTRTADGVPVKPGMRVSEAEARALLMRDLAGAARAVTALVSVPLAFSSSTMLRMLNAGDKSGAAAQFSRWNRAKGKVLPGLVRRRAAEAALFQNRNY